MSDGKTALVGEYVDASLNAIRGFFNENTSKLLAFAGVLSDALKNGGKLLIFGNGGSAADSQHFACELVNHYLISRKALPAIALTTDSSNLTAIGNDLGFEIVFARQIEALGSKGDVAIGISTSGESTNVNFGLKTARNLGLITAGITGRNGGEMPGLCDHILIVPHNVTPVVQQVHGIIVHILCDLIERNVCAGTEP